MPVGELHREHGLTAMGRTSRVAFWAGLVGVALSICVGGLALVGAQHLEENEFRSAALRGVRSGAVLLDELPAPQLSPENLALIERVFTQTRRLPDCGLVLLDDDGRLLFGTGAVSEGSRTWSTLAFESADHVAEPLAHRLARAKDVNGVLTLGDARYELSLARAARSGVWLGMSTPEGSIARAISRKALPWWIALGAITLVLLPLPILVLHRSARRALAAERDARARLEASDAALRAAIESLPFTVSVHDLDGRVQLESAESARTRGVSAADGVWRDQLARASRGEVVQTEVAPTERETGRAFRSVIAPVRTEAGITAVTRVDIDVTDSLRVERELRLAMKRLELHADNALIALIEWDRDLRIARWSGAAERLFGWTSAEMLGKSPADTPLLLGTDLAAIEEVVAQLVERGGSHALFHNRSTTKHGRVLHCAWHNSVVRDEAGAVESIVSFVQDVTSQQHSAIVQSLQERVLKQILDGRSVAAIVDEIFAFFGQVLADARCSVLRVDDSGRFLRAFAASGLSTEYTAVIDGLVIEGGNGTCGSCAASGRRVVTTDVRSDPWWEPYRQLAEAHGIRACWSQPICSGDGRVLATFALYFGGTRSPLATEIELLETAASLVGFALERENATRLEETRRETLRGILERHPLHDVLTELARGAERQVPGMHVAILLRDPDGLQVRPFVRPQLDGKFLLPTTGFEIGSGGGACGVACFTKARVVVHDTLVDPVVAAYRDDLAAAGMRAKWSEPILSASGDALGTFAMLWREPRSPTAHESGLLESFTNLAALAIEQFHEHVFSAIQRHVMKMILDGERLDETLTMLVRSLERQLMGLRAAVIVNDRENRVSSAVAGPSLPAEFLNALQRVELFADVEVHREANQEIQPVIVRDVSTDPRTESLRPLLSDARVRAVWSIPVFAPRGEVLGAFVMLWREPCEPGVRERATFEFASSTAALAIEHFHAHDRQRRLNDRLTALHEIGQAILSAETVEDVARAATERVLAHVACSRASVLAIDHAHNECEILTVAARGATSVGRGFVATIEEPALRARSRLAAEPVHVVEDLDRIVHPSHIVRALRSEGVRALASVPLIVDAQLLGTLDIGFERTGAPTRADQEFLVEVANMLAVAMQQTQLREQERHLSRRLRVLTEVGRAILSAESVAGVAVAALEHVHSLVTCQRASLMLYDFEVNEAEIIATAVRGKTKLGSGRRLAPAELGIASFDRESANRVRVVTDIEDLAQTSSAYALLRDEGVRAITSVPVLSRGETIGVLEIGLGASGALLSQELAFVGEIADLLSLALHQAQLTGELRRHAEAQRHLSDRLGALNNISRAILAAPSVAELIEEAIARTRQSIGCDSVIVALFDEDARTAHMLSSEAGARPAFSVVQSLDRFPAADIERLRTGEPLVMEDLSRHDKAREILPSLASVPARSAVFVPLALRGKLLGVLGLAYARCGTPHPRDIALAREIGALLAVGVAQNRLNEQIRRNAEELERRVVERTTELTEVNDELESYVRTVSHDLRAPLRAIHGLGAAVMEDNRTRLDEQGVDFLGRMIAAAERMDQMLLDLLAYSRLGKAELCFERVDLGAVVRSAQELVQGELDSRGAELVVVEPLAAVRGHAPMLVQALSNLFTNAAKFTRPGTTAHIRVWTEVHAGLARIHVADDGIGVAPAYHERIFRAFERLHGPEHYPGTGIGLAIVRRAIERMGGRVGVESRLGEGSVFWIELPCSNEHA